MMGVDFTNFHRTLSTYTRAYCQTILSSTPVTLNANRYSKAVHLQSQQQNERLDLGHPGWALPADGADEPASLAPSV
jgi:hypothetical protein